MRTFRLVALSLACLAAPAFSAPSSPTPPAEEIEPPKHRSVVDIWTSIGAADLSAQGSTFGVRGALGVDFFLPHRHFTLGLSFSKPWTRETASGPVGGIVGALSSSATFSGKVSTNVFLINSRFFFIPETAWVRAGAGMAYLSNTDPQVHDSLNLALSLALGYQIVSGDSWGAHVEAQYEYRGGDTGILSGLGLLNLVGVGFFPDAHIFSLNLAIDFTP